MTLAWAVMNNGAAPDKLADDLPKAFLAQYPLEGSGAGSSGTRSIGKKEREKS
jgi:hypothetical protein